ncbi:lipase, putative [Entamoeba histolytica HM-1:IMSS-B]|uniref:sn-1-specific diacylglycerol lipase n=6 Tax=Entamoeba histolytica TaxID=5759 RepID=C4M6G0_ENTH1|nr:lipase, putative [Entamoeba histolytica HM-1:IMSS]EMD49511.1 lipase, putative [Entamoeba histolytica KU27]EMH75160.1 lipase, putative [Entamoeba histolytica HM-1:IMSS-B]EMS13737.1 lipase domain containing protein [Entamoeba histolytica HM-3:IMSS]ENY63015.1 lipase containing protein, putative [Entamoeba histolytica HM-1:IMSS-A]GAT97078.1 lipase putative [Entamoeba histolytica]|eukprot:XP_651277.1 lipase, putative [Entamoeba histolytica HM-1:IMSS]
MATEEEQIEIIIPNDAASEIEESIPQSQNGKLASLKAWLKKSLDETARKYLSSDTHSALYQIYDMFKKQMNDFNTVDAIAATLYIYVLDIPLLDKTYLTCQGVDSARLEPQPIDLSEKQLKRLFEITRYTIGIYGVMGIKPKDLVENVEFKTEEFNLTVFLNHTKTKKEEIVEYNASANTYDPSYLICVKKSMNAILIVLRGTLSLSDCVTDLIASPEQVNVFGIEGLCHSGIFHAGKRRFVALASKMEMLHSLYPDYQIIITGHSLGGGVGIVLSALLLETYPDWDIKCFAFAPAAAFSKEIACCKQMKNMVISLINNNDIVPRLSLGSFEYFKGMIKCVKDIVGIHAKELLVDSVKQVENPTTIALKIIGNKKDELVHAINLITTTHPPFIPSGRVIQMFPGKSVPKPISPDGIELEDLTKPSEDLPQWFEVPNEAFGRILPKMSMYIDHIPHSYESIVNDCIKEIGKFDFNKPQTNGTDLL